MISVRGRMYTVGYVHRGAENFIIVQEYQAIHSEPYQTSSRPRNDGSSNPTQYKRAHDECSDLDMSCRICLRA